MTRASTATAKPPSTAVPKKRSAKADPALNRLLPADRPAHDWYRFVLSYPPHLVRDYVQAFDLTAGQTVFDPFCGTGTTVVECQKLGLRSLGFEANPMAHFASRTKTDWSPDPARLLGHAEQIAARTLTALRLAGVNDQQESPPPRKQKRPKTLRTLSPEQIKLLLANSISPLPLHKTLVLLDQLSQHADPQFCAHERLALANALVFSISNLHFGPEVGVTKPKPDAAVVAPWFEAVQQMSRDLAELNARPHHPARIIPGDARDLSLLENRSLDAVITSPPYPNEKDYTRTTRLESVLLGFIRDKVELRSLKKRLVRSNTRSVYSVDDDDAWVKDHSEIQQIARDIEARRIALGKTSGFERMYHRVAKLYFGGMAKHFHELRRVLKPGAQLAYVVGDQASYLRVMIRTGQLLADIAASQGYVVDRIDLFRTRAATATREQLREEVVILRWPGKKRKTIPRV